MGAAETRPRAVVRVMKRVEECILMDRVKTDVIWRGRVEAFESDVLMVGWLVKLMKVMVMMMMRKRHQ